VLELGVGGDGTRQASQREAVVPETTLQRVALRQWCWQRDLKRPPTMNSTGLLLVVLQLEWGLMFGVAVGHRRHCCRGPVAVAVAADTEQGR
jgi:hypothetical protein